MCMVPSGHDSMALMERLRWCFMLHAPCTRTCDNLQQKLQQYHHGVMKLQVSVDCLQDCCCNHTVSGLPHLGPMRRSAHRLLTSHAGTMQEGLHSPIQQLQQHICGCSIPWPHAFVAYHACTPCSTPRFPHRP